MDIAGRRRQGVYPGVLTLGFALHPVTVYFAAACRDVPASSKDADGRRVSQDAEPRYSTLRGRNGGTAVRGLRQPASGTSSFSITELHSRSPSFDCAAPPVHTSSPERTPPPPALSEGSTATVLARYWPPPDGQAGRHAAYSEGTTSTDHF